MIDYSLEFSGLEEAAGQMVTISRQLSSFLEDLQTGTMKSILNWESGARDLFDSQRNIWAQGAADMTTQADNAAAALRTIIEHYAAGERAGYAMWNK
ncbi:WXG100 family type VII secretion target [Streptomyces sp. NPDC049687]|uniref:WXG100 family type VII secretion target n=1 Tax=Streptomyces sp. NPDC049687 TaxID=3365596 RepID=UPI0037946A23